MDCSTCNTEVLDSPHRCPGGPEDGHLLRFEVSSRMSSRVVGEDEHTDADWFGPPHLLLVRAWSLPAALAKATELPFAAWTLWPGGDDEAGA